MSFTRPSRSCSPGFRIRLWLPPALPVVSRPSLRAEYDDRNQPFSTPPSTILRAEVVTPSAS